ncbi:hypothetical protein E4P41_08550 [Geodermatophilus sp. DF01-2]|uniref:hypothetical protein n=1 Tax=Geodermatophilus sp. DF01-2 TaxID=2559610 RepID=UPI0010744B50|nr:hypothetical protein [Geodermatophilus sp. DF01_2]TFV62040.1 hypothetical protein E4P41_08550 [Geodermatophilus sp. DF01_2]
MPIPPPPVSERPPEPEVIAKALGRIVRRGLPVTPGTADDDLLALRGVWARSIDPDDRAYRVQGLDRLLRELLTDYPDDELRSAAQVLFGMAPGSRGTTLTKRLERVAQEQSYTFDHVRQDIQKKIVQQVAWLVHVDSQTYTPRGRGVPPPLAVSGDTPQIAPEDLQTRERLEHEVALSHLWALVYALRAEILTVERHTRFQDEEGAEQRLDVARQRRDRLVASLGQSIEDYVERWGERITHGEAEFDARRLVRLAGWRG